MEVVSVTTRPMGQTEKLFYAMQKFGGANVFCVAEVRGAFSAEKMSQAISRVVARHALLRSRVELREGWPQLVLHTRQDLPFEVVEDGSSDVVDEIIGTSVETDYYQAPWLWKVTCILDRDDAGRFWLLLGMNHSITDGTAMCHMLHNLLRAFSDPAALGGADAMSLEPTLESYLNHRVSLRDHYNFWPTQLGKQFFPTDSVRPDAKADSSGRKTRTVFRQFDAEFSEKLRQKARAKQTTVNGALSAAIIFALAKRIDLDRRLRISMDTNVSFRNHFGIPVDQAGPLVSILSTIYKVRGSRAFWDLARECKQSLVALQDKNLHWAANHMWESLQRWMSDAARMKYMDGEKLGRLDTVGISNVGNLDIPAQLPGLTIENIRFGAAQHGFGFYFAFYVLSYGGKLGLNLAFAEPVVSRATAQALLSSVADLLERAIMLDDFSLAEVRAKANPKSGAAEPKPASGGELSADRNLA